MIHFDLNKLMRARHHQFLKAADVMCKFNACIHRGLMMKIHKWDAFYILTFAKQTFSPSPTLTLTFPNVCERLQIFILPLK